MCSARWSNTRGYVNCCCGGSRVWWTVCTVLCDCGSPFRAGVESFCSSCTGYAVLVTRDWKLEWDHPLRAWSLWTCRLVVMWLIVCSRLGHLVNTIGLNTIGQESRSLSRSHIYSCLRRANLFTSCGEEGEWMSDNLT